MQTALGVEHLGEAEQIVLVCATAVVEDEQASRVSVRRTLAEDESAHVVRAIVASLSAQVAAGRCPRSHGRVPGHDLSRGERKAGMRDAHIGGVSIGGILVIVGIVLAILLGHWWIGLVIALVGLIVFGGFARGKWY